ncbi:MAG: 30S ribosomal protein S18 [Candidatus Sungbacteria bacterium]|nr:30S ribosomal protein S18 [Candidatus Sungbacteria bacterium]
MTDQKQCFFCTSSHKVVDYKDAETLRRFMSSQMKIMPRRRSSLCATHQRALARAIKRSRELSLVPYKLH